MREQGEMFNIEEIEAGNVLERMAQLRKWYLDRIRSAMRYESDHFGPVTPDDARMAFEGMNPPPPEVLSRNFLACVFQEPGWEVIGFRTHKSRTRGSHGNRLNVYRWRGI